MKTWWFWLRYASRPARAWYRLRAWAEKLG